MNVCGLIRDRTLAERLTAVGARAGWSVWLSDDEQTLVGMLAALTPHPDVVVSDDLELFYGLGPSAAAWIFLGERTETLVETAVVDPDVDDERLLQHIKTCVNARRFRSRFAELDRTEPITSLPRHEELFDSMKAHNGRPLGLIIVQLDHADHLYANLDPVSKTDLLSALANHVRGGLPPAAQLGFYDAGCFVVALPQARAPELPQIAQTLLDNVSRPMRYRGGEIHFTVSLGHAFDASFGDIERLWGNAWQAALLAAEAGGNRVCGPGDTAISDRLPGALEREEFSLVLQAQWSLAGDRLRGAEALLRWQGMEVGELAPGHFIPIAEQRGHMARIGDWVLEQACREASTWLRRLVDPMWLGVNVSPQQFHNGAIVDQIRRFTAERWLDPAALELELSHDHMLYLVDEHREQLYALRDWGVRLALDNLGHSLIDASKLLRCPADTLKIDRSLISVMTTDPEAEDLVAQICRLGERFKLRTVAVGVETDEQLTRLADFGCSDVQGYLLSPPVPLADFYQLFTETEIPARSH